MFLIFITISTQWEEESVQGQFRLHRVLKTDEKGYKKISIEKELDSMSYSCEKYYLNNMALSMDKFLMN